MGAKLKDLFNAKQEMTTGGLMLKLTVVAVLIGLVGIFMGYVVLDSVLYASNYNEEVIFTAHDQVYLIKQLDHCSRVGAGSPVILKCEGDQYTVPDGGYVLPSKWDYVMDRVGRII